MCSMAKVIGAIIGYIWGGFWGLVLGIVIGHVVGRIVVKALRGGLLKHQAKVQHAFFEATFSVMGHLAKADGRVTEQEIQIARRVMQNMKLGEAATQQAMALFAQGKSADFDLEGVLLDLRRVGGLRHRPLMQMFIEIQVSAGYADGDLAPSERTVLLTLCEGLGFTAADLERIESMVRAEIHGHKEGAGLSLDDAYAILSIKKTATDSDVKRAYRRLMSQHHPDKLEAKGLPKEMMKIAEEKTHEIRMAYEKIRDERGFK
ncbi:DnaJ-like protein DjlA [hydrothermal vent metagenome]|uniref:DnaJ-like protein DjlA n=1 Tax=hydrothermal vent metagenome TaxID=652676 RepID=A0A3B0Z7F3_9ZZZZ